MNSSLKIAVLIHFLMLLVACSSSDENSVKDDKPEKKSILAIPFTGEVNWTKTFGGSFSDEAKSVITTTDGGFLILGNTQSIDGDITDHETDSNDYWLIKLDDKGAMLWNKTYGGSSDDQGEKLMETTDGGYIISGYSKSTDNDISDNKGFYDHWIVKVDALGIMQWEKSYGFAGDDRAFSIIQTTDGGFLTTGFLSVEEYKGPNKVNKAPKALNSLHGVGEFWVHKLDNKGGLLWEKFFGGTNNDRAYDAIETSDGYLLIGATESDDFDVKNKTGSSYDFWIVKIDVSGNLKWQKTYGGTETEIAYAITKTPDNNFIIVGDTRSTDGTIKNALGNADAWVIKIDPTGNLLWEQTYGGSDFDSANDIITTANGNYIVVGNSRSDDKYVSKNNKENDVWVFKINDKAEMLWNASFGGSKLDFGLGVAQNSNNEVIIVGSSQSSNDEITNKGRKDAFIINIK